MADICAQAGIATGSCDAHFSSKAEISTAVIRQINADLRAAMRTALERAEHNQRDSERAAFRAYFDLMSRRPWIYRIVREAEFLAPGDFRAYYERLVRGYARGVRAAQLGGEVDARYDPELVAYVYTGLGHFVGMRWAESTSGGRVPDDVLDDLLQGARPRPAAAAFAVGAGCGAAPAGAGRIVEAMTSAARSAGTIPALLTAAADRDPDGIWLRADDDRMVPRHLTFSAAAGQVGATARALAGAGLGRGDLVLVIARTTPPYLLCWLALAAIGAITVPANPRSAPAELAGLASQTRPRALICDAGLAGLANAAAAAAPPELGVLDIGTMIPDWTASVAEPVPTGVSPDDLAVLIPTSGTTGRSKLVMQTHRAYAMAGEGFPFWMELSAADRLMTSLPLFHINAPAYSVMGSLACGAGLVLLPRFSASGFLDAARRHGATEFNAIGAMLEILMRQPERPDDADNPLRLCYTGPAPERRRQLEIESRFGLRIVVGYALSESPYGLIWAHGTRPYGTLGSVRQHPTLGMVNEARVVGEDGRDLGPGETGELLLRNPVLTRGYWGMPEETAQTIVGGWLHTGDLVTVGDDGTYTFVSRKKEVLRRRGENLSPREVEEVLDQHPAVQESAVVGVASELSEDEVKAFVVAAPGARLDFAALREFAAQRLAAFKVPRFWQQIDELPRTPTARLAKHRLPAGHQPGEYDADAVAGPDGAS